MQVISKGISLTEAGLFSKMIGRLGLFGVFLFHQIWCAYAQHLGYSTKLSRVEMTELPCHLCEVYRYRCLDFSQVHFLQTYAKEVRQVLGI